MVVVVSVVVFDAAPPDIYTVVIEGVQAVVLLGAGYALRGEGGMPEGAGSRSGPTA